MRDHPRPRNQAARSVQSSCAGAICGPACGSCSPARDPGRVVWEAWLDASRCSRPAHLG